VNFKQVFSIVFFLENNVIQYHLIFKKTNGLYPVNNALSKYCYASHSQAKVKKQSDDM